MKPSWKYRPKFLLYHIRHDTLLLSMSLPWCPLESCLESYFYWHISSLTAPSGISLPRNGKVKAQPLFRIPRKWFSKTFNYKESPLVHKQIFPWLQSNHVSSLALRPQRPRLRGPVWHRRVCCSRSRVAGPSSSWRATVHAGGPSFSDF